MSEMSPTRRDALRLLAATAALGAAPAMPWRPALAQSSDILRWGSSSLGSTGYVIIEALVQTANKHSDLRSSSLATAGGAENMVLIDRGELEFGQSTSSDWAPATKGEKPFPEPVEAHQMFAYTIWNIPLIVHADSGIGSFADLAGKRVMPSQPGSAAAVMYQTILRAAGLEGDVRWNFGSWTESYDAFKSRAVDAVPAVLTNGRQSPQVEEVLTAVDVMVLATPPDVLDKAQALNPGILRKEVAPEAWAALEQPMAMPTISGVVAAHPSISPDVGYALTKAIFDNAAEVRKVGVQLQDIDINFAVDNLLSGYPVNAGAARYFQEKGVWRDDLVIAS